MTENSRSTIDLPIPHDPAERERARYRLPAEYTRHLEGACGLLNQGVPLTDECLASIAISLKRIADAMCDDLQSRGVRPSPEAPPTIPRNVTAQILDRAHAAMRTVDCEPQVSLGVRVSTLASVGDAIAAIEEFAREHGITLTEYAH